MLIRGPAVHKRADVETVGANVFGRVARQRAALELRGEDATHLMFAVAVPKALSKTLRVLIDELEGDHLANAAPTLLDGPPDGDV